MRPHNLAYVTPWCKNVIRFSLADLLNFGAGSSSSSTPALLPPSAGTLPLDSFGGLGNFHSTNVQTTMSLDAAFEQLGSTAGEAPVVRSLGTTQPQVTVSLADVEEMSAGALKRFLASRSIDTSNCVEKSELLALARAAIAPPPAAAPAVQPTWVSTAGPRSALELGLPNAYEMLGLEGVAPDAARRINEERAWARRAAAGDAPLAMDAYLDKSRRAPLASLVVPLLPPARLAALPLPVAALNPVIREVTPSYVLIDSYTELSLPSSARSAAATAAAAAAPSAAAAASGGPQRAAFALPPSPLLPPPGTAPVGGPRRYWELPLRPDVGTAKVLQEVAAVGRALGLDSVHSTARSLLLQQRVTVPAASFAAAFPETTSVGPHAPVVVRRRGVAPLGIAQATGSSGGWLSSWGGARSTTYVNSLTALLGTNASGERALFLIAERFLPPAAGTGAASKVGNAAATASSASGVPADASGDGSRYYGRLVTKDRPGGAVVGTATARGDKANQSAVASTTTSSTSSLMAALSVAGSSSGGGTGITVILTHKRGGTRSGATSAWSYRVPQHHLQGAAHAGAAIDGLVAATIDDPFLSSPSATTAADDDGSAAGTSPSGPQRIVYAAAEAALLALPPYPTESSFDEQSATGGRVAEAADVIVKRALVDADGYAGEDMLPGFDDGAIVGSATASSESADDDGSSSGWAALRVSLLSAAWRGSDTSSGGGVGDPPATFPLAAVDDELVGIACELTAALRRPVEGGSVLAEGVWADAVSAARAALEKERGADTVELKSSELSGAISGASAAASIAVPTAIPPPTAPAIPITFGGPTVTLADALATLDDDGADTLNGAAPAGPAAAVVDAFTSAMTAQASAAATATTAPRRKHASSLTEKDDVDAATVAAAEAEAVTDASRRSRFVVHDDTSSAIRAGLLYAREPRLFEAAAVLERVAAGDESVAASIRRAALGSLTATVGAARGAASLTAVAVNAPAIGQLPLPSEAEVLAEHAPNPSTTQQQPALVVKGLVLHAAEEIARCPLSLRGAGLTAAEEALRDVYTRARAISRVLAHAVALATQRAERAVDVEIACRLLRKRRHVRLRCSAAFAGAVAALSVAHEAATAPATAIAPTPASAFMSAHFGMKSGCGEGPLIHAVASGGMELVVTPWRLLCTSTTALGLGTRATRNIAMDSIIAARAAGGAGTGISALLLGGAAPALSIAYVDNDKVAAAAAAAGSTAARREMVNATSSTQADLVQHHVVEADASATVSLPEPSANVWPVSVGDAFDDLCELGASESVVVQAPVRSGGALHVLTAVADTKAPTTVAAVKKKAPNAAVPPRHSLSVILDTLTQAEALAFVSSAAGGSRELMSLLTLAPTPPTAAPATSAATAPAAAAPGSSNGSASNAPVGVDRDGLLHTLLLLRQLHRSLHLRRFDFRAGGGERTLDVDELLRIGDASEWHAGFRSAPLPLLLRPGFLATPPRSTAIDAVQSAQSAATSASTTASTSRLWGARAAPRAAQTVTPQTSAPANDLLDLFGPSQSVTNIMSTLTSETTAVIEPGIDVRPGPSDHQDNSVPLSSASGSERLEPLAYSDLGGIDEL